MSTRSLYLPQAISTAWEGDREHRAGEGSNRDEREDAHKGAYLEAPDGFRIAPGADVGDLGSPP